MAEDGAGVVKAQRRLFERIAQDAAETADWTGRAVFAERTMWAMARVPRHAFVSAGDRSFAYENRPLAIGHGQTISQPFIVALMTDLLDLEPSHHVLEIGTGCGYQAAVLAELAARVFTVETVPELAEAARHRLEGLGYGNVVTRCGDGFEGWPEHAPFDAIIVTAAPLAVPPALVGQLKTGGRLIVPIGRSSETQMLYRCVRHADETLDMQRILPVAFVPMLPRT